MPWGRLEDTLHDNEKVATLSDREFRVWILSISRCNRKRRVDPEGRISEAMAIELARQVGATTQRQIAALIAGLLRRRPPNDSAFWDPHPDGAYALHDFSDFAPREDKTAAERKRAERDRRRDSERDDRDSHAPVTRDTHARGRPGPVPGPVPGPTDLTAEVTDTPTAGRLARVQTMARAVPKPGEPGAPDWPLYEAFAAALGCEIPTSPSAKRKWSEPIWELHRAGVAPGDVAGLVRRFDEDNSVPCSPQGIANQLPRLTAPRRAKATNGRPSKFAANVADFRALHEEQAL